MKRIMYAVICTLLLISVNIFGLPYYEMLYDGLPQAIGQEYEITGTIADVFPHEGEAGRWWVVVVFTAHIVLGDYTEEPVYVMSQKLLPELHCGDMVNWTATWNGIWFGECVTFLLVE